MKDCAKGSSINPSTSRCRKDCKDTHERNPAGRCVKTVEEKRLDKGLANIVRNENKKLNKIQRDEVKRLAKIERAAKKDLAKILAKQKKEDAKIKRMIAVAKRNEKDVAKKIIVDSKKEEDRLMKIRVQKVIDYNMKFQKEKKELAADEKRMAEIDRAEQALEDAALAEDDERMASIDRAEKRLEEEKNAQEAMKVHEKNEKNRAHRMAEEIAKNVGNVGNDRIKKIAEYAKKIKENDINNRKLPVVEPHNKPLTCEISELQVREFAKILGVDYRDIGSTCGFISKVLKLPDGTILTRFIAKGASGLVIGAQTPSGKSYIAKVLRLSAGEVLVRNIFTNSFVWGSSTKEELAVEVKNNKDLLDVHSKMNILGDIKGVSIPKVHSHHTVTLPSGEYGIILMDNIKGIPLGDLINDDKAPFERTRDSFMKLMQVLATFHGKGVSHGDPHPWNVIVLDGTYNDIAIIDFGRSYLFTGRFNNSVDRAVYQKDTRHTIVAPSGEVDIRKYDVIQAMFPFYMAPYNKSKFVTNMGGVNKIQGIVETILNSRRCLKMRRFYTSDGDYLEVSDQVLIEGLKANLTPKARIEGFHSMNGARGLGKMLAENNYGKHSWSRGKKIQEENQSAVFHRYDFSKIVPLIRAHDITVDNRLIGPIPELNIPAQRNPDVNQTSRFTFPPSDFNPVA